MRLSRHGRPVPSDWHGIVLYFPRESRLGRDFAQIWRLGELVAACTRLGRMPVMHERYGVPGARQRPERVRDMKFHAEPPVPMVAGYAANAHLEALADIVGRFRSA